MLFMYTLILSLVTLVTEGSVTSDCMKFLVDEQFHVPCAALGSSTRKPCLMATAADHQYLKRYGVVSSPGSSTGQMICAPKDDLDDVDCVSTRFRSSKNIEWMWTAWAPLPSGTTSRTMYYMDNGSVTHCPYGESFSYIDMYYTDNCPYVESFSYIVVKYTIDDYGEAYADGKQIDDRGRWATTITLYISADTQVLAFRTFNQVARYNVGVRAWVSTGIITDTSSGWKCSQVYEDGWNQVGFDDSHWGGVNEQGTSAPQVVGNGAITVGCFSKEIGPFYFRKTLN